MKIAIAGYGVEGRANYQYWSKDHSHELTIVDQVQVPDDQLPAGVKTIFGETAFEQLDGYDLVIRTAGLAPFKIKSDGRIWSATNEFFEKCPCIIIGVTGSKGKGTTASLIASILRAGGRTVHLVGNIGQPGLEIVETIRPDDIVVYELSSFQLWDAVQSPHTAVVLYIEKEHLDVHRSMDEYVSAKANIARFQSVEDSIIYDSGNTYARWIAELSPARKIAYPSAETVHIVDDIFYYGEQKLCSVSHLQLRGEHNIFNAIAAINAAWPYVNEPLAIEAGLENFSGLPHRLAYVATVGSVHYYDDSIATTPSSAIAALRSFDQPKTIILGGSSKGSDFSELATELTKHHVFALLIGDEAGPMATAMDNVGFHSYEIVADQSMPAIVTRAARIAEPGSVVLLSPAAASFGLFKNYIDRGEQFIAAVQQLSI